MGMPLGRFRLSLLIVSLPIILLTHEQGTQI